MFSWTYKEIKKDVGNWKRTVMLESLGVKIEGEFERAGLGYIVDSFCQQNRERNSEDYYWIGLIWSDVVDGKIGITIVDVGASPGRDIDVEHNNIAICAMLKKGVITDGMFHGGAGDQDGFITVSCCVDVLVQQFCETEEYACWMEPIDDDDTWMPLEVGTTSGHTTVRHLNRELGVARWPYGSTKLVLIHGTRRFVAARDKACQRFADLLGLLPAFRSEHTDHPAR